MIANHSTGSEWDLSDLFTDLNDPNIDLKIIDSIQLSTKAGVNFKGKITEKNLLEFLQLYEEIYSSINDVILFAKLLVSADQANKDAKELQNKVQNALNKIEKKLTFASLEIGNLLTSRAEIIQNEFFKPYKHYLEKILRNHKYKLSEAEENLIIEKNQYGITEWSKLLSQW